MASGKGFVVKIEFVPLARPARVIRTSGTVEWRGFESAGDVDLPRAQVYREKRLHSGDAVRPRDKLTLAPGARLALQLADGRVADYIAHWDRELKLAFVPGGDAADHVSERDPLDGND
jgi:hypothetical protein